MIFIFLHDWLMVRPINIFVSNSKTWYLKAIVRLIIEKWLDYLYIRAFSQNVNDTAEPGLRETEIKCGFRSDICKNRDPIPTIVLMRNLFLWIWIRILVLRNVWWLCFWIRILILFSNPDNLKMQIRIRGLKIARFRNTVKMYLVWIVSFYFRIRTIWKCRSGSEGLK